MKRLIRYFVPAVIAVGLTACAAVKVFPEHRAAGMPTATATAPVPQDGNTRVVQRGDTLYGVASRLGVSVGELASWNDIRAPYTIHPGQRLLVRPAGRQTVAAKNSAGVGSPPLAHQTPAAQRPASRAAKPSAAPIAAVAPPTDRRHWGWPADGAVIAPPATGASATPGLYIAGEPGAAVRAVGDGIVLYSGSGSPGYEEVIVIRHDDNWVSSYSHNRKRLVGEGERIRAGAQIAEMGRTGVPREMLHFELRRDGTPVDPLLHLPKRPAH
ncbi:MAG: peptidoglycan DD-metalloendopeptidase family protein [Pseudoxanthomonas sp.]